MKRPLRTLASLASLSTLLVSQPLFLPEPAQSQTPVDNNGCPAGTKEATRNRITNGNFVNNTGFTSQLPYRGDFVYPDDAGGGGISIQNGAIGTNGAPPPAAVNGRGVNPDEAARAGVDPVSTYLYSNPNLDNSLPVGQPTTIPPAPPGTPPPVVWQQTLNQLAPNTTYNFKGLFFNLLTLPQGTAFDPRIVLQVGPPGGPYISATAVTVGDNSSVPGFPNVPNVRQAWIPVQLSFTTAPGQTSADLRIVDSTQNLFGDDFGLTAIGLRECAPNIGVAKSAGTPIDNGNGTFTIPYTVRVSNLAPVPLPTQPQTTYDLRNLQLTDPLTDLAAKATINSITGIQSPTLAVNPAYSGTGNPNLLLGTDTLAPQTTAVVSFNVILTPGTGPEGFGPFSNTVVGDATTQGGSRVSNRSNDGVSTDPSGNQTGDGDTPTVVQLPPLGSGQANLLLVKRITNVTRNGTTLGGVNFGGFVDDPGTTDDTNPGWTQLLSTGSPVGVPALDISTPVTPGDEVEYTVYFLSSGSTAALATNVCDLIPAGTSLVPNTTQVQAGTTPASSGGTVFTPPAPLPANNSCLNQSNPNGAVIFNLSDLPNTPAGNVGFVRFRVRIN